MKYIVQIEIDPDAGLEIESQPEMIQEIIDKFQALKPSGMYFSLTRRCVTVIVDVANEDAMFEALHATWRNTKSYPDVWPVADLDGFPEILKRAGIGQ
jgi:hypothetical protein